MCFCSPLLMVCSAPNLKSGIVGHYASLPNFSTLSLFKSPALFLVSGVPLLCAGSAHIPMTTVFSIASSAGSREIQIGQSTFLRRSRSSLFRLTQESSLSTPPEFLRHTSVRNPSLRMNFPFFWLLCIHRSLYYPLRIKMS